MEWKCTEPQLCVQLHFAPRLLWIKVGWETGRVRRGLCFSLFVQLENAASFQFLIVTGEGIASEAVEQLAESARYKVLPLFGVHGGSFEH